METLVDDFFIFRFNISDFTSFEDTCLKLKSFALILGKHSWIFLILPWILKTNVIWFMSASEELLNGFRISFLVVCMGNLFIVLEITLPFVMITSFSTGAILLEFVTRFYRLPEAFVISYATNIYIAGILLFWFSEKIHAVVSLGFTFIPIFMISILKVIF